MVNHCSSGVTWVRTAVLVSEGALLVVDRVTVADEGSRAVGWRVGPSFPLQIAADPVSVSPSAMDAAGFNSTGCLALNASLAESTRLLLWFGAWRVGAGGEGVAAPISVGTNRVLLVGRVQPAAVFAQLDGGLKAGVTVFASLLLPHDGAQGGAGLAGKVKGMAEGGNVSISFPVGVAGGMVHVAVDGEGKGGPNFVVTR